MHPQGYGQGEKITMLQAEPTVCLFLRSARSYRPHPLAKGMLNNSSKDLGQILLTFSVHFANSHDQFVIVKREVGLIISKVISDIVSSFRDPEMVCLDGYNTLGMESVPCHLVCKCHLVCCHSVISVLCRSDQPLCRLYTDSPDHDSLEQRD
jgi:hypothetical protein